MVYTEIKKKNGNKYYYRVKSIRKGSKFKKERKYLGLNLDKSELNEKEKQADKHLNALAYILTKEEIKFLDDIKKRYLKQTKENFESRYESFCSKFTYNSNAIEGNTLTLQETAQLLFENIVPASKSLREINEALNHKRAFDYLLKYDGDITKEFILKLHELVVKDTLKPEITDQTGRYRTLQVYIRGVDWIPIKPSLVSKEMGKLMRWYNKSKGKLHPFIIAAYFHIGFETIHPFIDGNGRVGRLLMNFILHKNNYPMINISTKSRSSYYESLNKAQVEGNLRQFIEFLIHSFKDNEILV